MTGLENRDGTGHKVGSPPGRDVEKVAGFLFKFPRCFTAHLRVRSHAIRLGLSCGTVHSFFSTLLRSLHVLDYNCSHDATAGNIPTISDATTDDAELDWVFNVILFSCQVVSADPVDL